MIWRPCKNSLMHKKKNSSNNRDSSRLINNKMKDLLRDLVIIQLIQHALDLAQLMNVKETINNNLKSNKNHKVNKTRMAETIDSKTMKEPPNNSSSQEWISMSVIFNNWMNWRLNNSPLEVIFKEPIVMLGNYLPKQSATYQT